MKPKTTAVCATGFLLTGSVVGLWTRCPCLRRRAKQLTHKGKAESRWDFKIAAQTIRLFYALPGISEPGMAKRIRENSLYFSLLSYV